MSRFSACPRYSSSGSIRVADPSFIVNDCPPVPATPDAARHSSLPSYTASVHGAETPCERSDGYPTAATYYARSPGQDSAVGKDELPSYAKFAERSRVERCFRYGFLLYVPLLFAGPDTTSNQPRTEHPFGSGAFCTTLPGSRSLLHMLAKPAPNPM